MNTGRFQEITGRYPELRVAIVGDFCLDRYFEIDPTLAEESIETGLEVHNVTRVRTQPGAAGTILNNLIALGIGEIIPIGFCGDDGEGWLLERALRTQGVVNPDHFLKTHERLTFTYTKPLVMESDKAPRELNRLDQKNWTPTPDSVSNQLAESLREVIDDLDALIVMDQVDIPGTGVVTPIVKQTLEELAPSRLQLPVLADSRQGLGEFPPLSWKMNAHELGLMVQAESQLDLSEIQRETEAIASRNQRPAFVTLAEQGIVGAASGEPAVRVPSVPVKGELDIVGAGDSVTANLAASLAAGATVSEAMELAMAAASIVVHQLGTTGTASREQMSALL